MKGRTVPTTWIREVAELAGVSVGTVCIVLNRPDVVAATTRQRVLDAIEKLGFVRNEAARSLRAGRSRTVGLLVLDVANPFFTDVAAGAESVADVNNTVVTLCNSGEDAERERRHLAHLEEQRVQGVLVTPVDIANGQLDRLVDRGIPVVLVDRGSQKRNRCSVAVNDLLGGRLAATHLVELGHRRIAFVGGPMSIPQVSQRRQGAETVVAEQEPAPTLTILETDSLTVTAGRQAAERLVAMPATRRATGVVCANDLIALGVLQVVMRAGLRVPNDIAIVGYDDIVYAEAAAVPLSSVRQPREQLGRTAAELLFEEICAPDKHRHRQVVFEPELVVRASSDHRRRRSTRGQGRTRAPTRSEV